jgi:hypothetical protein
MSVYKLSCHFLYFKFWVFDFGISCKKFPQNTLDILVCLLLFFNDFWKLNRWTLFKHKLIKQPFFPLITWLSFSRNKFNNIFLSIVSRLNLLNKSHCCQVANWLWDQKCKLSFFVIIQKQHTLTDITYFKQFKRNSINSIFGWYTLNFSVNWVLHLANQS